jgi:hypothetical protein
MPRPLIFPGATGESCPVCQSAAATCPVCNGCFKDHHPRNHHTHLRVLWRSIGARESDRNYGSGDIILP